MMTGAHVISFAVAMASPGDSAPSQPSRAPKVAFGPFEFDPHLGQLRKNGYRIKLPGQAVEILSALIRHPGEVITRQDLRVRLWPGMGAGNFEHGINAAVNKLRQVLGDTAAEARYIETLPGRGYRFVAPISTVGGSVLELIPARSEPDLDPRSSRPRVIRWAIGTGTVSLVLAVLWFARGRSPVALKPARLLVSPPKGYYLEAGGVRQSFALSPDGERIAFTAKDASGAFRVFLRYLSEPESHPIADSEGGYSAVWSPDGKSLFFTAKGKLRRIGLNAAVSQVVSDSTQYFSTAIPFGSGRLLVCDHRSCGVIPSSGGPPGPIRQWYSWAQLLPGGREFLYTIDEPQLGSMCARIAAIGTGEKGIEVVRSDSRVQYRIHSTRRADTWFICALELCLRNHSI